MGDFVLKLINAPINDLSGFASKQGFIFFFIIIIIFYIIVAFCRFGFSLATKCQISVYTYLHMWKMLMHPASLLSLYLL